MVVAVIYGIHILRHSFNLFSFKIMVGGLRPPTKGSNHSFVYKPKSSFVQVVWMSQRISERFAGTFHNMRGIVCQSVEKSVCGIAHCTHLCVDRMKQVGLAVSLDGADVLLRNLEDVIDEGFHSRCIHVPAISYFEHLLQLLFLPHIILVKADQLVKLDVDLLVVPDCLLRLYPAELVCAPDYHAGDTGEKSCRSIK